MTINDDLKTRKDEILVTMTFIKDTKDKHIALTNQSLDLIDEAQKANRNKNTLLRQLYIDFAEKYDLFLFDTTENNYEFVSSDILFAAIAGDKEALDDVLTKHAKYFTKNIKKHKDAIALHNDNIWRERRSIEVHQRILDKVNNFIENE